MSYLQEASMMHYCQRQADGTIHVTNQIGPYTGQHHIYSQADFDEWASKVSEKAIDWDTLKDCHPCDCGQAIKMDGTLQEIARRHA